MFHVGVMFSFVLHVIPSCVYCSTFAFGYVFACLIRCGLVFLRRRTRLVKTTSLLYQDASLTCLSVPRRLAAARSNTVGLTTIGRRRRRNERMLLDDGSCWCWAVHHCQRRRRIVFPDIPRLCGILHLNRPIAEIAYHREFGSVCDF